MRGRWMLIIPVLIACIMIINDCNRKSPISKSGQVQSSGQTYSGYSDNYYGSSGNSQPSQSGSSQAGSYLKAKSGEMILAKAKSPGYYKTKGDQVIELWDDGTVADTYQAIGAYNNVAEFKKVWKGAKFANPLRSVDTKRINGLLLFGPVNEDYDDYRGVMYDVYGLITITGTGFEYYENTFGKPNTFTYIQDLVFVDQKD